MSSSNVNSSSPPLDSNNPPTPTLVLDNHTRQDQHQTDSMLSRIRKECLSFTTSAQESFRHAKAFFVGQAKKITAKDEKEASEADLQTAKMQVEATNEAEETKKRLDL